MPGLVDGARHAGTARRGRDPQSDIQRGFIRAEVVAYDALIARGSMAACREHGEVRLEGKEYVVQDGDVINFRFAT
jgi:ribosome-binding ATPase